MNDRTIAVPCMIAYVLWTLGAGLIILSFVFSPPFGQAGLYLAGAGGVMQIRGFVASMQEREQHAFDLGRESVRLVP